MKRLTKCLVLVMVALLSMSMTVLAKNAFELKDGTYDVTLTLEGGSGRATVKEETTMCVIEESVSVIVEWSSPNYDYMIVDGCTYYPINTGGNSVFEIPVLALNEGYKIIGDTVAMSTPHEIEYTLTVNYKEGDNRKWITAVISFLLLMAVVVFQFYRAKKNFIDGNKSEEDK